MMGNTKSLTLGDVYGVYVAMDDEQKEATCAMIELAYSKGYSEGYYEGRLDAAKLLNRQNNLSDRILGLRQSAWGKELFDGKDIL